MRSISLRSIAATSVAAVSFFFLLLGAVPRVVAQQPTLVKRTVMFDVHRYNHHYPTPNAAQPKPGVWSWIPTVSFTSLGFLPGGSRYVVEVYKPDGKLWLTHECVSTTPSNVDVRLYKSPYQNETSYEKIATIETGKFPFKIVLKNELNGTNETVFSGNLNVKTYSPDQSTAEFRGKKEFYIDEDWRLPLGFVWDASDADSKLPPLAVQMWFKGRAEQYQTEAFLFHNGKQVASTRASQDAIIETVSGGDLGTWKLYSFTFYTARSIVDRSALQYGGVPGAFFISDNPGDYEVKVLRSSKLARILKFSVGKDGKVIDNGIATRNKLGGVRKLFPVKVIPDQEPAYNVSAWKTDLLYGNNIADFSVE